MLIKIVLAFIAIGIIFTAFQSIYFSSGNKENNPIIENPISIQPVENKQDQYYQKVLAEVKQASSIDQGLLIASKYIHPAIVKDLLTQGANVNITDEILNTPLLLVAQQGCYKPEEVDLTCNNSLEVTKLLVEAGANIDTINKAKHSAIYYAVDNKNPPLVQYLVENKAEVSLETLYHAINKQKAAVVQALLKAELDLNSSFNNNRPPLQHSLRYATSEDSYVIMQALVEAGADVNLKDEQGNNALMVLVSAVFHKDYPELRAKLFESLLEKTQNLNIHNKAGDSILHQAVKNNHLDYIKILLNKGIDPNIVNIYSLDTPLMISIKENENIEITNILINNGANINHLNKNQETSLSLAAKNNKAEVIEILCQNSNLDTNIGDNAFVEAMKNQHNGIAYALLSCNLNWQWKDKHNNTLLHIAAAYAVNEVLLPLKNKGLDINAKNHSGKTPVMSAKDVNTIKILGQYGADLQHKDKKDNTILHWMAYHQQKDILEYLFSQRIRILIDSKNYEGKTPLHLVFDTSKVVIMTSNYEKLDQSAETRITTAKVLLQHKANINAEDNDKNTPFLLAARYQPLSIIKFLIAQGANIKQVDYLNRNAVDLTKRQEVISYLCKEQGLQSKKCP